MQTDRLVAVAAWVLAVIASIPTRSSAAVDLNGQWHVEGVTTGDLFPGFPIACGPIAVVQSGTSLTAAGSCSVIGSIALSGTIDPGTGAFTLLQAPAGACTSITITATASGDSYTFSGWLNCQVDTLSIPGTISGSRCGNGVLDPSEQCDHAAAGDCCNPTTCQFESAGTACASDGAVCTDDVCTGAGVCQHLDNTGPCDDGNPCTTDVCGGGTCNGSPRPVGTSCSDGDACTTADQCDASATCAGGPPLACDPPCATGVCDPDFGCVADIGTCDDPTGPGGKLALAATTPDTKDKLTWTWSKGPAIAPGDFGNPVVDTTYTLCVSDLVVDDIGEGFELVPRSLHPMTAPAGSRWLAKSKGFKYVDKTGTPNGLNAVTLTSGIAGRVKIKVKGKGSNLFRNLEATGASPVSAVPLVQLKASNGRCWDTPELVPTFFGEGKLKAKGSPSGAFLD